MQEQHEWHLTGQVRGEGIPGSASAAPGRSDPTHTFTKCLLKTHKLLPVQASPGALTLSTAAQGQSSSALAQLLPGHPLDTPWTPPAPAGTCVGSRDFTSMEFLYILLQGQGTKADTC